jgi:hypothetical protein
VTLEPWRPCLLLTVWTSPSRLATKSKSKLLYDWLSVSMSWYRAPLWDLRPDITSCRNVAVWICGLVSVGRPFWREDGSAICSVIIQWSESLRTWNHTLLSHLRLPQPGGPGSRIYIPQEQGGPVIPPALGSLYVVSYDSQGYGGGILTLPTWRDRSLCI